MSRLEANLACPACQGPLRPAVLECRSCGVKVEGPFQFNEFASLSADDLHLLRIFVMSEGRIREMEAPLGLSYPTIRARLSALREKIHGASPASAVPPKGESVDAILEQLQREAISFDEAMRRIRAVRGTTPPSKRGKKA